MAVLEYTEDEIMTVVAARQLPDASVCFVGIGLPSIAANLARLTTAPNITLIYESGAIGARPDRLPLSIGDGVLAETSESIVSVPEVFNYWLQPGRVDVGFLGAAQLDKYGNINTTFVGGTYEHPDVRLPGAGGAPEIAASCKEVVVVLRHSLRAFVERVDFVTSFGFGMGRGQRQRMGFIGAGPRTVISDLGILEPDPSTEELTLTHVHPSVAIDAIHAKTAWPLRIDDDIRVTEPPTPGELAALRSLIGSGEAR